ncbi:hypothetical protein GQ55_9G357100 [Panicum hallii var. hallii]|uniref:Uncharacterized protein n=1 Tax=Panicum hallii var. hallii TaxID=1504633 RepID=A0A2T7C8P4_9POAL|nr:hypothetical protein GQ55_9G357100 [Panicum hallii var. hallii]
MAVGFRRTLTSLVRGPPASPCAFTRWRRRCTTRRARYWRGRTRPCRRGPPGSPTAPAARGASWPGSRTCSTTRRGATRSSGTPGRSSSSTTSSSSPTCGELPPVARRTQTTPSRDARHAAPARREPPRGGAAGAAAVGAGGVLPGVRRAAPDNDPDEATLADAFAAATAIVSVASSAVLAGVSTASAESAASAAPSPRTLTPYSPARARQPDVAGDRPAPAAADHVVRGRGAEGAHGQGSVERERNYELGMGPMSKIIFSHLNY